MRKERNKNLNDLEVAIAETEQALDALKKKTGGGGKLSRSETVTVRLDPKLRYLAELAARKQRRTVSSFIEWAVEDSLSRIYLYESNDFNGQYNRSIADESSILWDVDEADRFVNLAIKYPELLSHDEQKLWKLIRENGWLWKGNSKSGEWKWKIDIDTICYDRLRESWEIFKAVAEGHGDKSTLPTWKDHEEEISF